MKTIENQTFDMERALYGSRGIALKDCAFDGSALWYSTNIEIKDTKLHGIKALRECSRTKMQGCDIISPEFL